jgi:hypothetical protein
MAGSNGRPAGGSSSAGAEDDLLARDEQRELALEHIEGLVVATVDVQRGHFAAPPALVEEGQRPAAGVPVDGDVDVVVDESSG